jgi:hypothetical protein
MIQSWGRLRLKEYALQYAQYDGVVTMTVPVTAVL